MKPNQPTKGEKKMKHTKAETERAQKKVEIAIDKLVDLQDMGFGCDAITRALELLNGLNMEAR
jgi:hypothetical protein